jgi:hypothetical protein
MCKYLYEELPSCVEGEIFQFCFTGVKKARVALFTEDEFAKYEENQKYFQINELGSPVYFKVKGEGKHIVVLDLDGEVIPVGVDGQTLRFSPLFTIEEIKRNKAEKGIKYVANAHHTDADRSMIQYWKDNQDEKSTIDLNKGYFICPSCGKKVQTSVLHGAHVNYVDGSPAHQFITPTCDSCNTSKVDRIFKVSALDLIDAPE